MNNLIFLTSHRQIQEVLFYAKFLERTKEIKNFDLILHNNNPNIDIESLKDAFNTLPNKNKHLIFTHKNNGGYHIGCLEALTDFFNLLQQYDNVIHSHSDVFIVNEDQLLTILNSNLNTAFLVNYAAGPNIPWMSTDLFIMRPKLVRHNIFKSWCELPIVKNYKNPNPNGTHIGPEYGSETVLYNQVIENNLSYKYIKRYDTDNWNPRRLDMWGCWHEHDLSKLVKK